MFKYSQIVKFYFMQMEVYKNSLVDTDEFTFGNIVLSRLARWSCISNCSPYFRNPVYRTRLKYETLMDPLSDKSQYSFVDKRKEKSVLNQYY